jgi:hypothetical protein
MFANSLPDFARSVGTLEGGKWEAIDAVLLLSCHFG